MHVPLPEPLIWGVAGGLATAFALAVIRWMWYILDQRKEQKFSPNVNKCAHVGYASWDEPDNMIRLDYSVVPVMTGLQLMCYACGTVFQNWDHLDQVAKRQWLNNLPKDMREFLEKGNSGDLIRKVEG